jgi:uncharacterized protein YerC
MTHIKDTLDKPINYLYNESVTFTFSNKSKVVTTAATIRDVTREAGVSVATVSRVLNSSSQVSEEINQKVQATIDALDYSPSQIAHRL